MACIITEGTMGIDIEVGVGRGTDLAGDADFTQVRLSDRQPLVDRKLRRLQFIAASVFVYTVLLFCGIYLMELHEGILVGYLGWSGVDSASNPLQSATPIQ